MGVEGKRLFIPVTLIIIINKLVCITLTFPNYPTIFGKTPEFQILRIEKARAISVS